MEENIKKASIFILKKIETNLKPCFPSPRPVQIQNDKLCQCVYNEPFRVTRFFVKKGFLGESKVREPVIELEYICPEQNCGKNGNLTCHMADSGKRLTHEQARMELETTEYILNDLVFAEFLKVYNQMPNIFIEKSIWINELVDKLRQNGLLA